MNKQKLSLMARDVKRTLTEHSPAILTGVGIAGMLTSVVLASKATPIVLELLEEASDEKAKKTYDETGVHDYDLTKMETLKLVWKPYLPATVAFAFSAACLIGANSVHSKRNAALATAYKLSETALIEYKDKVVETIGDKKEREVRDKIAKKHIEENPVSKTTVHETGKGFTLCYEPLSGRYFKYDRDKIQEAENKLNKQMLHEISGYVSVNEFYDEIGLERTDMGYSWGWNTYNLIDIDIRPGMADNKEPCAVIYYVGAPQYGYEKF